MTDQTSAAPTAAFAAHGLLTRGQLMVELGIKDDTLREWEQHRFPTIRRHKKHYYHVPTVIRWMLRNNNKKG